MTLETRDTCHIIHVPRDARQHGATVFGAVGTCWGGYLVARLCSYGEFRAGVSFHPATTFVAETVNQEKLYEASRAGVECGLELQTKVHPKVRNRGEGPYLGLSWLKVPSSTFTFKTLC